MSSEEAWAAAAAEMEMAHWVGGGEVVAKGVEAAEEGGVEGEVEAAKGEGLPVEAVREARGAAVAREKGAVAKAASTVARATRSPSRASATRTHCCCPP